MKKVDLFGKKQSRGTFDDFFDTSKYKIVSKKINRTKRKDYDERRRKSPRGLGCNNI